MKTQIENSIRIRNKNDFRSPSKAPSKKEQILELWDNGVRDLWHIALDLASQPSYVASVLQNAGKIHGYYDLYTSPDQPMNVYFETFRGKLGYRDMEAAQKSVRLLEELYYELLEMKDRAGQHHCLVTALTLFNRARYSGKIAESELFRSWIIGHMMGA